MTNNTFRILDGGQSLSLRSSNRHFISAYVTDTRLMGVLAVYSHWHVDNYDVSDQVTWGDLHQFFYIDCEETGIETYHEIRVSDEDEVLSMEQTIIGGLGAKKIELSEAQLCMLMNLWRSFNEAHGLPLPDDPGRYDFLFTQSVVSEKDRHHLMEHICPAISTDYQLINYFMMRCFGNDREGAEFLATPRGRAYKDNATSVRTDIYSSYKQTTMWRNTIDKKNDLPDGSSEYICESIVEMNGQYDRVISLVTTKDLTVTDFSWRSTEPITSTEAAIVTKKSEFVTLYNVLLSEEELDNNIDEFTISFHMTMSEFENGRLFLSYRPNNDHVNRRVFQLNGDVNGLLFLTVGGQLILSAYSEEDAKELERKLSSNVLAPHLVIAGRYEFRNPVLYEFMHSDIDYFETYLRLLMGDD